MKGNGNTAGRITAVIVVILLTAILTVCTISALTGEKPAVPSADPTEQSTVPDDNGTVTLMIYMIGSDLESKSGSGSKDLEEMAASGIDTSRVNLLVLSGGSEKWHNGLSSDKATLQRLTADGFKEVDYSDTSSMGDSKCLAQFLNYAYDNYKADSYDLILWDHGNGPLIGYGKDTLNNNDSLTLPEMKEALEASPFKGDNKLGFIGFDACLMASAELVLTVDDYARYLVASQEIEPVFGWDYAFLKDCGKMDTAEFAEEIASGYLKFSEDYFADKDFMRSPVTLSVTDLSCADELESAINGIFKAASMNVSGRYSSLAKARTATKSPGRGSTGSEYDFVDLMSLADEMEADYKDEVKALRDVLSKMIISNSSSEEDYCGLSLYYPFYNKNYYRASWHNDYISLGVLSDYVDYLARFDQIWLGTEYADYFELLGSVTAGDELNSFTLELTPEQQQYYLDSGYYIMRKFTDPNDGHDEYSAVYCSYVTDYEDGVITANYNGKALFLVTDFDERVIPMVKQADHKDGVSDFFSYFILCNEDFGVTDAEDSYIVCEMHFEYDSNTDEVTVDGIYEVDDSDLSTGRKEPIDPSDWVYYRISHLPSKRLTRNENGSIKAYNDWDKGDWMMWYELSTSDNVKPAYEELYNDGNEYFIMFIVEDVQGGSYCSELFPIILQDDPGISDADITDVTWGQAGADVFDDGEVSVGLTYAKDADGKDHMYMSIGNRLDNGINVSLSNGQFNGKSVQDKTFYCREKDSGWKTVMDITDMLKDGDNVFEFTLGITASTTRATRARQMIRVTIPGSVPRPDHVVSPVLGANADPQDLKTDAPFDIRLNSLGYPVGLDGVYSGDDMCIDLDIRNRSGSSAEYSFEGMVVNGVYIEKGEDAKTIGSGKTLHDSIEINTSVIRDAGNTSRFFYWDEDADTLAQIREISSVSLVIKADGRTYICDVALKEHAAPSGDLISGEVLYEDDHVKVLMAPGGKEFKGESIVNLFNLWIINKTDNDMTLRAFRDDPDTMLPSDTVYVPGGCTVMSCIVCPEELEGKWPRYYLTDEGQVYKSEAFELRY